LEEERMAKMISIDKMMSEKAAEKGELCRWFLNAADHLLKPAQ